MAWARTSLPSPGDALALFPYRIDVVNTQTSASATGPHLARLARWWRCAIGPKTAPLLACGLGALSVLAFAPFHYSPLLLLTLAGLFAVWRGQSVRAAALSGFSFGLGLFGAGVSWVYVSLHTYGGMPAVFAGASTLLFCAYLAVYPALAGALFAKLRSHRALFDIPLLAACWTMAEWLRGFVFTGFPWLNVGYSQTPPSPLAGFAPVLGVYGVGMVLALCAALVACFAIKHRRPLAIGLAAIALTGWGVGSVKWTQALPQEISVSLMQTNVEQSLKWRPEFLAHLLEDNHTIAAMSPARLMVLPETTLPLLIEQLPPGYLDRLARIARAGGGDLVLGTFDRDGAGQIFNSAISLGASPVQRYAKSHLVPFGEFSPPLFSWVYSMLKMPMSDQTRGRTDQPPLSVAGEKVAVNICYEDVFGEEIARSARNATLLLNLSNLAWYGDSLAQPQHLQIARLRALETGRPMLRATNTGMTAVVEPDGSVRAQLPAFTRGVLQVLVRGTTGTTPYVRWGNVPVVLLCAGLIVLLQLRARRR